MTAVRCPKCGTKKLADAEVLDNGNLHLQALRLERYGPDGRRVMDNPPEVVTPISDRNIPLRCPKCGPVEINLVTDITY